MKGDISQSPSPPAVPVLCTAEEELKGTGEWVGMFCRAFVFLFIFLFSLLCYHF